MLVWFFPTFNKNEKSFYKPMPHILQNSAFSQNSQVPKIPTFLKFTFFKNSHFSKIPTFLRFIFFRNSHFSKIHIFQNSHFSKIHNCPKLNQAPNAQFRAFISHNPQNSSKNQFGFTNKKNKKQKSSSQKPIRHSRHGLKKPTWKVLTKVFSPRLWRHSRWQLVKVESLKF